MSATSTDPAPSGSSLSSSDQREPQAIARSLLDDIQLLFRKHIELAQQEMKQAAQARAAAAAAGAVAGVTGLFGLGFLAAAAAYGLENVMAAWLARLIVGGAFLLVAGGAAAFAMSRLSSSPMGPERTKDSLKEDVQWAKTRMRR